MLRLTIALLLAAPLWGPIFPDWLFQMDPPNDLSVPAGEHARRDLIPGWEPVRALTPDEMAFPWSPFRMQSGGFYQVSRDYKPVPTIPLSWVAHWPAPARSTRTNVPPGWWWKPREPELLGIWLVLSPGPGFGVFIDMVTTPRRAADLSKEKKVTAMRALYAALREREAARRGVDPAELDREAALLEAGGAVPSVVREAIERARWLQREDRVEEAIALLEPLVDEGVGSAREQAMMRLRLAAFYTDVGDLEASRRTYVEARPWVVEHGGAKVLSMLDEEVARLATYDPFTPMQRLIARGVASGLRGNVEGARRRFDEALARVDAAAEPDTVFNARYELAKLDERVGRAEAARAHARAALAMEVASALPETAAELRALLDRLDGAGR
ncbi:MAG: hypothetical protein R3F65_32395 [bacterium]